MESEEKKAMTPPTKPGQEGVARVAKPGNGDIGDDTLLICDAPIKLEDSLRNTARQINIALSPLLTELEALRAVVKAGDALIKMSGINNGHNLRCYLKSNDPCTCDGDKKQAALDAYELAKKSALLGGEGE